MLIGLGGGGGEQEIITSSSLPIQVRAHTCAGTHTRSFTAEESSRSRFSVPSGPVCVSQFGKGTTNKCGALLPSS